MTDNNRVIIYKLAAVLIILSAIWMLVQAVREKPLNILVAGINAFILLTIGIFFLSAKITFSENKTSTNSIV